MLLKLNNYCDLNVNGVVQSFLNHGTRCVFFIAINITGSVTTFDFNLLFVFGISGVAALSLSVQGPSKADIKCRDNPDGTTLVTYKPTEPGNYQMTVKYGDEHVPGQCFISSQLLQE